MPLTAVLSQRNMCVCVYVCVCVCVYVCVCVCVCMVVIQYRVKLGADSIILNIGTVVPSESNDPDVCTSYDNELL